MPGHISASSSARTLPVSRNRPGRGSVVHGALDRPQDGGDGLPLVQEHRLGLHPQGGVRIGAEGRGLGRAIQAHDRGREAARGRGLAGGAGPGDEQRGQLGEEVGEPATDPPGHVRRVGHHAGSTASTVLAHTLPSFWTDMT